MHPLRPPAYPLHPPRAYPDLCARQPIFCARHEPILCARASLSSAPATSLSSAPATSLSSAPIHLLRPPRAYPLRPPAYILCAAPPGAYPLRPLAYTLCARQPILWAEGSRPAALRPFHTGRVVPHFLSPPSTHKSYLAVSSHEPDRPPTAQPPIARRITRSSLGTTSLASSQSRRTV